jgi:hypothetical protein
VDRDWNPGDVVVLDLPMPVRKVVANPRAHELAGKAALLRGPLVYCFEQVDNPDADVREIALSPSTEFQAAFDPSLLGGVTVLRGEASVLDDPAWDGQLYRNADDAATTATKIAHVTAIPYYAWANREPGAMTVWTHRG